MNEEAHKVILGIFCGRRKLSPESVPPGLADMICAVSAPYLLMIECLGGLSSDPSHGLLIKLIDRAYETAAGALALIAIGHFREAEILARSVYESSVTTAYIVKEAPSQRLAQFFRAYVRTEREQNRRWKMDIKGAAPEVQKDHSERINRKNQAMDGYDHLISSFVKHCGIDDHKTKKWPLLRDRLTALDRKIDYRTVYAAMCSQSHHDAEDILNYFFVNGVGGVGGNTPELMEIEANTFSILMVLFAIQWFSKAILAVGQHLKFSTVVVEASNSLKRIVNELQTVAPNLDVGEFPKNWIIAAI